MPDGYLCSSHDFNRGPIHYKINPSLLERDPLFQRLAVPDFAVESGQRFTMAGFIKS